MTAKVNIYYFIHDWARPEGPLMGRRPISRLQGLAKLARSANLLLVYINYVVYTLTLGIYYIEIYISF